MNLQKKTGTLRRKILIFNVCIVFGALCLFEAVFLTITYDRVYRQTVKSSQASFEQTEILLEEKAKSLRNEMDTLCLDDNVADILNSDKREIYRDILQWNIDATSIKNKIDTVLYHSNISQIAVITENPISFMDTNPIYSLENRKNTAWFGSVRNSRDSFIWIPVDGLSISQDPDSTVCFTRKLLYEYPNYETYFVGYIKKNMMERLLNANITDGYTSCYAVDGQGNLVFGKNVEDPTDRSEIRAWIGGRMKKTDAPVSMNSVAIHGRAYLIGAQTVSNTNLTMIYTCSFYKKGVDMIKENLLLMLTVTAVVLPLIFLFSFLTAFNISKPLETLKNNMMKASKGNFDIALLPVSAGAEVRTLTRCFNYMLTKISMLLDERYNYGKQIKDLELKSLQAQINPHFLYNTLDLIYWKAVKDGNSEIQNLVVALSSYYRKGLSKGADFVTLRSEIEHVESYVSIQNMRFDDGFTLETDVEPECLECKIPKLILQPLVENAIMHGILETEDTRGTILIKARRKDDILFAAVVDNGVGMPQAQADDLIEKPARSGYGIRNISERIRLSYGVEYGLSFISQKGRGTAAVLKMPYIVRKEENDV